MRDWALANIVWVADRGFAPAENRRYLRAEGGAGDLQQRPRLMLRLPVFSASMNG